jgi:hypothetical protein
MFREGHQRHISFIKNTVTILEFDYSLELIIGFI